MKTAIALFVALQSAVLPVAAQEIVNPLQQSEAQETMALSGRWLLEDLAGRGVLDNVPVTLEFGEDGVIYGSGGCNRFRGSMTVEGNTVEKVSPLASTMRSCVTAMMTQEQRYFQALQQAQSIRQEGPFLYIDVAEQEQPLKFTKLGIASQGVITGTVSYRERIALPPDSVVTVTLQDVSLQDVPAQVIAEQKIVLGDRQVPVPFQLEFDPSLIQEKHRYSIRAHIETRNKLMFVSTQNYPVITQANPTEVNLVLQRVSS